MPRYARIEKGVVREILVADYIEGRFHPAIKWIEAPKHVQVGWAYVDGTFVYREEEQEQDTLTRENT